MLQRWRTLSLQVLLCITHHIATVLCAACWSGSILRLHHAGVNSATRNQVLQLCFGTWKQWYIEECNTAPRCGHPWKWALFSRECQAFLDLKPQQLPFRSNDCWALPGGWLSNFVKSLMPSTPVLTGRGIAVYGLPCSPKETLSLIL